MPFFSFQSVMVAWNKRRMAYPLFKSPWFKAQLRQWQDSHVFCRCLRITQGAQLESHYSQGPAGDLCSLLPTAALKWLQIQRGARTKPREIPQQPKAQTGSISELCNARSWVLLQGSAPLWMLQGGVWGDKTCCSLGSYSLTIISTVKTLKPWPFLVWCFYNAQHSKEGWIFCKVL